MAHTTSNGLRRKSCFAFVTRNDGALPRAMILLLPMLSSLVAPRAFAQSSEDTTPSGMVAFFMTSGTTLYARMERLSAGLRALASGCDQPSQCQCDARHPDDGPDSASPHPYLRHDSND